MTSAQTNAQGAAMTTDDGLLGRLRALLGDDGVTTDPHDLTAIEKGWRYGEGKARAIVRPTSTEELSAIARLCHEDRTRLHAIGANTGLVGASQPDRTGKQIVVAFDRMNAIEEIDELDGTARLQAGVRLSELNEALEPKGLWFPIDLGADPQIGGMVVTNTGGSRLVRYGDVRSRLLGLEVVLHDGQVVDTLQALRKNNTGLDFKQLFVGTSGAYGFVSRAIVRLAPKPRQFATALVGAATPAAVVQLLSVLDRELGEFVSAYEAISQSALEVTLRRGADLRAPFRETEPAYAVLIELSSVVRKDRCDLEALLEQTLCDFVEAESVENREPLVEVLVGQGDEFWKIRHQISESLREEGEVLAFDLSVPRSRLGAFTEEVSRRITRCAPFVRVCDFGHWGDGGTHLNLVWPAEETPKDRSEFWSSLQTLVYDCAVKDFDGSFSAEHGVGPHNQAFYERYVDPKVRETARGLRGTL
ncbi:MAG: FAD-binding oxidoreductase [Planctomycetota bacterium]